MAFVYLVDTLSYDARGGMAEPFATLEGAMASRPQVKKWTHERDPETGSETWSEDVDVNSMSDIVEIRLAEVGP